MFSELRDKKEMTFHKFNFVIQERLRKILLLFNPQNFQSVLHTATFCIFWTPTNHLEFCDINVTALYPSVIILTFPFNLWITSFTAWCYSISHISILFLWCGLKFYLLTKKKESLKNQVMFWDWDVICCCFSNMT